MAEITIDLSIHLKQLQKEGQIILKESTIKLWKIKVVIKEIRNTYGKENWQSQSLILGKYWQNWFSSHQNQSRGIKRGMPYIKEWKQPIAASAMENEKIKRIFSKLHANKFGILL